MKLTILTFVFIVLCQVAIAQVPIMSTSAVSYNNCPLMEVSISSNNHNGILEVSYCNHGNVTAVGAYVEIEVTNDLVITQTTIPVSSVVGEKYTFHLGDVNSSDCAAFYIEIPNVEHKIHCTNVQIFPDDPCQEMIDRYILNHTGNDDDTDSDDINTASVTFSAQMHHDVLGTPLLGQGGVNSVFEDHVFLNNIPTWDSLLLVLTNSEILPNIAIVNTSSTAVTTNTLNDITKLASAELCSSKDVAAVVYGNRLSQVTAIEVGDRTVLGTRGDKQEGASTVITAARNSGGYENKAVMVRLYPNPFSTSATITIEGANYQQTTVEILDLAGKSIQFLEVNEQQHIMIDRGNLRTGVYFYRLIGDNIAVHTGKFIVR